MTAPAPPPRPAWLERVGTTASRALSLSPSNPRLRLALRLGLAVLVLASLGAAVASEWHRLPRAHWHLRAGWLAVAVGACLAIQPLHAALWRAILAALGAELEPRRARAIWCVSLLGRYVPTSALMAAGRVAMAEREGVPKRVCLASIVYELVLTVGSALAVGAYFVVTLPALRGVWERWVVAALPLAGLAALHPRVFHPLADRLLARMGSEPLPVSVGMRRMLAYSLWFVITFLLGGVAVYGLAEGIHGVAAADVPTVIGSYSVSFAVSILGFFSPAGLGAREAGLVTALSGTLPFAVAVTVAVVLRLIQIAVDLLYAGLTTVLARRGPSPRWSGEAVRRKASASSSEAGEPIS